MNTKKTNSKAEAENSSTQTPATVVIYGEKDIDRLFMEDDISLLLDIPPEGNRKKLRNSVRAGGNLITSGFAAPKPYKEEETDEKKTMKFVLSTSGQYPDGTSWERDATEEEIAEYESWCK